MNYLLLSMAFPVSIYWCDVSRVWFETWFLNHLYWLYWNRSVFPGQDCYHTQFWLWHPLAFLRGHSRLTTDKVQNMFCQQIPYIVAGLHHFYLEYSMMQLQYKEYALSLRNTQYRTCTISIQSFVLDNFYNTLFNCFSHKNTICI